MFSKLRNLLRMARRFDDLPELLSETYMLQARQLDPRLRERKRLPAYGYKVHSQNDEDGILQEIFRRLGITTGSFVEFGVGDGQENNTLHLLARGWRGAWIEGHPPHAKAIRRVFRDLLADGSLAFRESYVDVGNILPLLAEMGVPREFDLLSVDIDGNDYWVAERVLSQHRPRVLVIEYSPLYRGAEEWIMPYDAGFRGGTLRCGASLGSLTALARREGYDLVGCGYSGANAFFVRRDLCRGKFVRPATAENHYEPPRTYLRYFSRHKTW